MGNVISFILFDYFTPGHMLNFIAFPTHPVKILHYKNESNIYGSKVVLSGEPSENKNKFKNEIQNHFSFFKKYDLESFSVH